MSVKQAPSGPVDHVESISLLGAKVMKGTWPNGDTHVLIGEVDPYVDPVGAAIATENGELPTVGREVSE